MLGTDRGSTKAILLGALLLTTALAGCAGDSSSGISYASYEEAKNAPGPTFEATNTDSPIQLKLFEPATEGAPVDEVDVVFLLFDSETDEPVTNAQFAPQSEYSENCAPSHSFCAEHPSMGHGTSPEESPSHVNYGVYEGMTTISMNGDWRLNVNPEVDGQVLEFDIEISA